MIAMYMFDMALVILITVVIITEIINLYMFNDNKLPLSISQLVNFISLTAQI